MGVKLIAEVLDTAPADLDANERLILVIVAEAANDSTRKGWPGMDVITRRLGRSAQRVRAILAGLADKGIDLRVPLGVDKAGKPYFAARGRRTIYQIPDLKAAYRASANKARKPHPPRAPFDRESRTPREHLSTEKAAPPASTFEGGKALAEDEKGAWIQPERRLPVERPSVIEPSLKNRQNPTAAAPPAGEAKTNEQTTEDGWMPAATRVVLDALRADGHPDATVDDAKAVHRAVVNRYGTKVTPRWLRAMAANRSYGPFYADVRSERAERVEQQIREIQASNPPCEHDTPGGRIPHPTTGLPLCPMCRDARPPLRRNGQQTDPDVLAALDAYHAHAGRVSAATLMRITQEATALRRRNVPPDLLIALATKAAKTNAGLLEAAAA